MISQWIGKTLMASEAPGRLLYLTPPSARPSEGVREAVLQQMERDLGPALPLTLHEAAPDLLASVWAIARETLIAGPLRRVDVEALGLAIASLNRCPYCVNVHRILLHGAGRPDVVEGVRSGRLELISDLRLRRITRWALSGGDPGAPVLRRPPFEGEEAPWWFGAAIALHYINRVSHVFLRQPASGNGWWKRLGQRSAGVLVGRDLMKRSLRSGESLALLGNRALTFAPCWVGQDRTLARLFGHFGTTVEEMARQVIPEGVRQRTLPHIRAWQGEEMGPNRSWVENYLADFSPGDRAIGRMALLAALAPHQVDAMVVDAFRAERPLDRDLVVTASWGCFQTMRRMTDWLVPLTMRVAA